MPVDLLFVRHGESEWNALGRWQGQADPPLTELGIAQAVAAARTLGGFDAVVASTLDRARTSAMIIAEALGIGPVVVDEALIERDAGDWSGMTRSEIEEEYPGYLRGGQRPPGYEDDPSLLARTLSAIERIADLVEHGTVLVITHGGVIYTLEHHLGAPFERIENLGGRWFHLGAALETMSLGDRVHLVDHDTMTVQAPDQL